jgi:acyl-CoA dehydrogenase
MDFDWTREQEMWRRTVREFAQEKIAPRVREIDSSGKIPKDIVKGMADLGLLALTTSEEHGGAGASWMMAAIAAEELGRADVSLAIPVLYLVEAAWGFILDRYGTEELKAAYLPQVTAGKAFLGIATTEPSGGSDIVNACRTKAIRDNDAWVLSGEKVFVSGVAESNAWGGIHLTLARTDFDDAAEHKAFTFFALPIQDNPSIIITLFDDMGRMGISTGGFAMQNVRVPASHQVGKLNRGFYHAMEGFSAARVLIAATCVGAAEAVQQMGIEYIKERTAWKRPLASYEGIQFPLAEQYAEIEATRLLAYKAAWLMDQMYGAQRCGHHDVALAAAMAKMKAPLVGFEVMNEVANWFGALAYTKESPIEMGIRGIRSYSIGAEGTMNIMKLIIARELLGAEFLPYRQ